MEKKNKTPEMKKASRGGFVGPFFAVAFYWTTGVTVSLVTGVATIGPSITDG